MDSLAAGQLGSLLESMRLLETLVAGPLSLRSEIRAARRALPIPDAGQTGLPVIPASEPDSCPRNRPPSIPGTAAKAIRQTGLPVIPASEPDSCPRNRPPSIPGTATKAIQQTALTLDLIQDLNGGSLPGWATHARLVLSRAETEVGGCLRAEIAARVRGLYVIVDPEATRGRPVLDVAEAVLEGGASLVQLRDKTGDAGEILPVARAIKALCESRSALFIVNDDPALALASGAHGLHLGQEDMPVAEARRILDPGTIIGRSNNSIEEVAASRDAGADYLAVGAVFPTSTMGKGRRPVVGTELITTAKTAADRPIVAIGGIDRHNAPEVIRAGADCICAVGAVTLADDPKSAAEEMVEAIEELLPDGR